MKEKLKQNQPKNEDLNNLEKQILPEESMDLDKELKSLGLEGVSSPP